jgi:hypothetical protein
VTGVMSGADGGAEVTAKGCSAERWRFEVSEKSRPRYKTPPRF